jgi:hypothetical protein
MQGHGLVVEVSRSHVVSHIDILSHFFLHVVEHVHDKLLRLFNDLDLLLTDTDDLLRPLVLGLDLLESLHVRIQLHLLLHDLLDALLELLVICVYLRLKL